LFFHSGSLGIFWVPIFRHFLLEDLAGSLILTD
jgi:hypothetical protein